MTRKTRKISKNVTQPTEDNIQPSWYKLKAKTAGQQTLIDSIHNNKITLCSGPAGCGKTLISTAIGMEYLLKGKVEKLIITRPMISAEKEQGALPGTLEEKIFPYLIPIYEEMSKYVNINDIKKLITQGKIEVCQIGYLRGRNFINSYVVVDEAQNVEPRQLKMILTRFGQGSTMVLSGDFTQSDLSYNKESGFTKYFDKLGMIDGVGVIKLGLEDIVREGIIVDILKVMEEVDKEQI